MRPICGSVNCSCLDITNHLCQPRPARVTGLVGVTGLKGRPTREQLINHSKKYGWDQIKETAAQLGITLEKPKKRRRSPEETAFEVRALHAEGYQHAVIADTLQLSDSYVRKLLQPTTPKRRKRGKRTTTRAKIAVRPRS